jgi:hypothetical protein
MLPRCHMGYLPLLAPEAPPHKRNFLNTGIASVFLLAHIPFAPKVAWIPVVSMKPVVAGVSRSLTVGWFRFVGPDIGHVSVACFNLRQKAQSLGSIIAPDDEEATTANAIDFFNIEPQHRFRVVVSKLPPKPKSLLAPLRPQLPDQPGPLPPR